HSAGGGGWGSPSRRSAEARARDELYGLVTRPTPHPLDPLRGSSPLKGGGKMVRLALIIPSPLEGDRPPVEERPMGGG
ncbi:MAG: hypothetical protein ACHQRJ_26025, partial [Alphaproteobacteria bacterium]